MSAPFSFRCTRCGEVHEGLPDLAFDSPLPYHQLTPQEREAATLDTDTCVIADTDFFVRGCLEIPVHDRSDSFIYGVWVSLSREHFRRYLELYEDTERVGGERWFGWLSNAIPGYPDTFLLRTNVSLRPYPTRPYIELEPTDHPLGVEQREGITLERLRAILEGNRHGHAA